jgi:hypothetical protein
MSNASVVGQVGADAWKIEQKGDPERSQMLGRVDTGSHQDRRTAIRASAEHDPAGLDDSTVQLPEANRARVVENNVGDLRVGADDQVRRRLPDWQEDIGCRHAAAITGAHGHSSGAHGIRAVVIFDGGEAGSVERLQCGRRDLGQLDIEVTRDR